jgi:hypothetical protein
MYIGGAGASDEVGGDCTMGDADKLGESSSSNRGDSGAEPKAVGVVGSGEGGAALDSS